MSVGPMTPAPMTGVLTSAAGVPLAQTQGAEVDRAKGEVSAFQRAQQNEKKAESAAGIGATDGENHETTDRDADGRRPWEIEAAHRRPATESTEGNPPSRDASGNHLDLTA
jgi:hypothetical protein